MQRAKCCVCGKILEAKDTAYWVTRFMDDFGKETVLTPTCSLDCADKLKSNNIRQYEKRIEFLKSQAIEIFPVGEIGKH